MGKRITTCEQIKEICNLFQEGMSAVQVGKMFGITYATVYNYLKENNIKASDNVKRITEKEKIEICRLYVSENISSPEIGKILKVNPSTVIKTLKENNIQIRSKRIEINPGDKFGRWTVIEEVTKKNNHRYFLCECSCPDKIRKNVGIQSLTSGKSKSCGCYNREIVSTIGLNSGVDYTGQTFGKLTILYEVERGENWVRQVVAQCSCPDKTIKKYRLPCLKDGNTTSCGCYKSEAKTGRKYLQVKDYQEKYPTFCKVEKIRDCEDSIGIEVQCKNSNCKEWFHPTSRQIQNRIAAIERPGTSSIGTERNFYCSDDCKYSCILYNIHSDPNTQEERNQNQPTNYELNIWREENLRLQREEYGYNFCTINENHDNTDLIAHHIDPKKLEPGLALDPENCIIVCRECHDELHKGECSTGKLAYTVCTYPKQEQQIELV